MPNFAQPALRISAAFLAAVVLAQAPLAPVSKPRWELSYFYDEDESELVILDLKFPSPLRGIASGAIVAESSRKNVVLLTSNGGRNWSIVPVKEAGHSLFFLDESVGWMVTPKGIWKTLESGRSWKKQKSPDRVRKVYFRDEKRGYALCGMKSVYETADGGLSWKLLNASREPSSNRDYTAYEAIDFAGDRGVITGWSDPPRRGSSDLPDWMEPDKAKNRREWPIMSIVLETLDGGQTWKAATSSMFGRVTRVDLSPDGRGLALLEYRNAFEVPSEVVSIDLKTGKSATVFKKPDRRVTDVLLFSQGPGYLAAIEASPQLHNSPIPGKLKILRSDTFSVWQEMEVDYRALGTRAILAASGAGNLWVATSDGAILKLANPSNN